MIRKLLRLTIYCGVIIGLLECLSFALMIDFVYSAEGEAADKHNEAVQYFQIGLTALKNGKDNQAIEAFAMALRSYKTLLGTEKYQASCYLNIGTALEDLGRHAEAIENMEQALRLGGTELDKAGCYLNIGVVLKNLGRYTESIEKIETAQKLFEQLPGTEREQGMCYQYIGLALEDLDREEALEKFEQALSMYKLLPGTEGYQVGCYLDIVGVLGQLGRYAESVEKIETAQKLLEQLPGTELLRAKNYQLVGTMLAELGLYEQSEEKQKQALKLLSQLPDTERDQAMCYLEMGAALGGNYRYKEAIENIETALKFFARLPGTKLDQARCYHNIGAWLCRLNLYEEAMEKEKQALKLFVDLPDSQRDQAGSYTNIGGILLSFGLYEEAVETEEKALKLYDQLPDTKKDKAVCYRNIGVALNGSGRYEEGIESIETALKLYEQLPDSEGDQALCYHSIAVALGDLGRYGEGIEKEKQALMLLSYGPIIVLKPENEYGVITTSAPFLGKELERAVLRSNMGSLYLATGQLDEALSIFESIPAGPWWLASRRAKAYNLRAKSGDIDKAAAQLVKAMQSAEETRQNVFAMEHRIGVFEGPSVVFRDAVAMLTDWQDKGVQIREPEIARWMKDTAPDKGLLAAAFHFSEQGKGRALEDAIRERATLSRGSGGEELLLKQRELSLRLSKISTMREELGEKETERKKALTKEINDLQQQMSQLEGEIKRTQLGKYIAPEFRLASQMASELPADTAVLEYSLGEDEGWLLLMTRDGIAAHKLPVKMKALPQLHKRQQAGLNDLVAALQNKPEDIGLEGLVILSRVRVEDLGRKQSERNNFISEIQEAAILERLGAAILPAAALKELNDKKIKRLLISADNVLHTVPFAMVRLKDKKSSNPRYLIESYTVSCIPSLATLETIRQQKAERKAQRKGKRADLLAFANPTNNQLTEDTSVGKKDDLVTRMRQIRSVYYAESGLKLISLPETEQEALRVASLFAAPKEFNEPFDGIPESNAVVFNGPGADESQVKRLLGERSEDKLPKNWKYVLFSTHGFADMRNGMLSCIAFSTPGSGSNDDGFLQAQEVLGFKMDTDVVMLAACETGLGNLSQGDGLLGLSASFFIAGTETVAASLWQVESGATSQLVTEFFRNLKAGEMDRAEALRQAQLTVMKKGQDPNGKKADYSSPYFWGAFVLMGEYIVDKDAENK